MFIQLGATKRERLFMAGNRVGKSQTGAFETACHLTGRYPEWFDGKQFSHPIRAWVCGASGQSVRDVCQYKLFGILADDTDTGMIARDLIVGSPTPSHGVSGLFDTVRIRHVSGGISTLNFKSYEQSVEKWMGTELDFCWVDEEAPPAHYHEALARLTGDGMMIVTFTPLGGLTDLLCRFLREENPEAAQDRAVVQMSLEEALHFSDAEKRTRIASYAAHERESRTFGTPALGSGAVFTIPVEQLQFSDLHIPYHWPKLWAVDFGGASQSSHPFAAVLLAWDRDTDIVYVLETVRLTGARVIEHCAAMRRHAPDIRVAWPHDGSEAEKTSGKTLQSAYREHGLRMLPTHAAWPDGGISTERGIMEMEQRMADGRFRVRARLSDFFDEYRGYHRKDGKLVKVRDDLMSATRIGIMALRHAQPGPLGGGIGFSTGRRQMPRLATGIDFDLFGT